MTTSPQIITFLNKIKSRGLITQFCLKLQELDWCEEFWEVEVWLF